MNGFEDHKLDDDHKELVSILSRAFKYDEDSGNYYCPKCSL